MNGYLTGSSGSVYFSVRTYGEIVWLGHDLESSVYVRWQPVDMSSGMYYYTYWNGTGRSSGTVWLSTVSYAGWTPISSAGYLPIDSSRILEQYFEGCTWTDIETNMTSTYASRNYSTQSVTHGAFGYCSTLRTANLYSCTFVDERAFEHCSRLISVNLPVCTHVSSSAFNYCTTMKSIYLPKCYSIGESAFLGCYSLSAITLGYSWRPGSPSTVICRLYMDASKVKYVFSLTGITSSTGSIYVPSGLVDEYQSDSRWAYFRSRIFSIPE